MCLWLFPLSLLSNNGSSAHTLLSCNPVTLKDQLKVTVGYELQNSREREEEEWAEARKEEECVQTGVQRELVALPPSSSIEVSLKLNSKLVIIVPPDEERLF